MLKTNRPTQQLWTEEAAGVDEVSSEDEIIETELRDSYPKRQRRHPQTLTYDRPAALHRMNSFHPGDRCKRLLAALVVN